MSEPIRYMVSKEWSAEMLRTAESVVTASSDEPQLRAFALGVLVAAWPRLIDAFGRSEFGHPAETP